MIQFDLAHIALMLSNMGFVVLALWYSHLLYKKEQKKEQWSLK